MPTVGEKLKAAREVAKDGGVMSLEDAAYELRGKVPKSMWLSRASLGRIEQGKQPAQCWLIDALAQIYGVTTQSISEEAAAEVRELRDLLRTSSAWMFADGVSDGARP